MNTFDTYTSKEELAKNLAKCCREFYTKWFNWISIALTLGLVAFPILFSIFPDSIFAAKYAFPICLVTFLSDIVFLIIYAAKSSSFKARVDSQLAYAPPTAFTLRIAVLDNGVEYVATEFFRGFIPRTAHFKFKETSTHIFFGCRLSKIYLAFEKRNLMPENIDVLRSASF